MTDKAAADLKVALDAMRLARAEDHKACARLTARVKELEKAADLVRDILCTVHPSHLAPHGALGRIAEAVSFDPAAYERYRSGYGGAREFAEGTRDEKSERCDDCGVPLPGPRLLTRLFCGACAFKAGTP